MPEGMAGASEWEQDLLDHLAKHGASEGQLIDEYRRLAESTRSPGLRYLLELILVDEVRHHELFADLARAVRALESAESSEELLALGDLRAQRNDVLAATQRFLEFESEDERQLASLETALKPVGDTSIWRILVSVMARDTQKHIQILRFIRDRVSAAR